MSSDIENLIKKINELENRVSLLENPNKEKIETDIMGRILIK